MNLDAPRLLLEMITAMGVIFGFFKWSGTIAQKFKEHELGIRQNAENIEKLEVKMDKIDTKQDEMIDKMNEIKIQIVRQNHK